MQVFNIKTGVTLTFDLINISWSMVQSRWNTQDTPPNTIFAAMNVKINHNKWANHPCEYPTALPMQEISG